MPDLTPETVAELRRLLDAATPGPWMVGDEGDGVAVIVDEGDEFSSIQIAADLHQGDDGLTDARLIAAAVNALPALLDAAEERDEIADRLSILLCDLTGGRLSKTTYPVPVMVQEIERYLSECHESDLRDERDALLAIIDDARHALSADGPKVEPARQVLARALPQTTAWQDRTRHARDNTPPHVIAHRGAQLDAVTAERDALEAMLSGRCLSDITHRDEGHRQSVCMLPEGHAPLAHDDCMGCTWTDADHWQSHAPERLDAELHAIADESQHEGWDSPLVRRVLGRLQRAYDGEARP